MSRVSGPGVRYRLLVDIGHQARLGEHRIGTHAEAFDQLGTRHHHGLAGGEGAQGLGDHLADAVFGAAAGIDDPADDIERKALGFQVFDVVDDRDVLVGVDADAAPLLGRGYQSECLPLADVARRHGHPLCQLVDSQVHQV
ncbi:hypothetical protein CCUG63695_04121 [Mycobacteroides franklinii]|uniref:Uncharacterized protein n=1 Tax=Mycobacteroides franklinii TaxID=948102 RepID=A0A4V6QET7_9MYCO|nr:hypothetical protein CCUG64054_04194 [Mycobacteroides franklinii]TDZ51263.1 hypothetical protein CCUG63697_02779 [Mycobacteroides franklinii]TDZ57683.1 hypothetical protein CCUG63696_04190 [Mycobacteroides franklinii]TDZ64625.1 hypothetical protein CCUG63695_04121 [Mycobacteroides franklinii]TDZ71022.1 hypothetical protein CCUG64056_04194 [Mycobacteroides franklinii]